MSVADWTQEHDGARSARVFARHNVFQVNFVLKCNAKSDALPGFRNICSWYLFCLRGYAVKFHAKTRVMCSLRINYNFRYGVTCELCLFLVLAFEGVP